MMSDRPAKTRKKMGRPTIFTQELADLICETVATHTFGLKKLCAMYDHMPDQDTINQWRFKFTDFSDQYMRAKAIQAQLLAEEIMDIADDGQNDWMETSDDQGGIGWKLNGEHVQRSRLRIDTRKWHASKLAPKIYGNFGEDRKEHEGSLIEKLADKLNK
jgi:hypothetical protein